MHDLEILRDAWAQPDPPAPAAHAAARLALLERQEAAAGQGAVSQGTTTGAPRQRRVLGLAGRGAGASGAPRRPGPWRARRLALAATGLAVATAAGVLAVQSGGSAPAAALTVQQLAYRTAAVAAAGPNVRPGQWVYWQEEFAGAGRAVTYHIWTTADSREAAYTAGGKIHTFKPGCGGAGGGSGQCGFIGQPGISGGGPDRSLGMLYYEAGHLGVSYAALRSLPHNPQALDRYIAHLNAGAWSHSSAPVREFMIISDLLTSYVMPPALTAELYRSLGDIPGVTLDHHAVDVAGRTGIGFRLRLPRFTGRMLDELIVDPHTYRLMASQGQVAGQKPSGVAILRRVLVSGPGVRP